MFNHYGCFLIRGLSIQIELGIRTHLLDLGEVIVLFGGIVCPCFKANKFIFSENFQEHITFMFE